jgi:hypothetical protein
MTNVLRRHPLLVYFVLAFAGFWACIGLGYAIATRTGASGSHLPNDQVDVAVEHCCHDQRLSERMGVPRGARAWLERDGRTRTT